MPEAPINKNGNPVPSENEIRPAGQSRMPPPAFDATSPKDCRKFQFGVTVSPGPNRGHYYGTFLDRKNIRHVRSLGGGKEPAISQRSHVRRDANNVFKLMSLHSGGTRFLISQTSAGERTPAKGEFCRTR
jgi:hypothetical protein